MKHLPFILALSALFVAGHSAMARTWSVEQDESGDWVTIQEAVDASASGDTIMIGAGRYSEIHPVPGMATTTAVAHLQEAKDLIMIGAGQEETIIGPENFTENCAAFFFDVTSTLAVSGVQFVNAHAGIWTDGDVELEHCTFDGCWIGGGIFGGDVMASGCIFTPPVPAPVGSSFSLTINNSSNALIEECHFTDLYMYIEGVSSCTVRGCVFEHPNGNNQALSINFVSSNGLVEGISTDGWVNCQGSSNVVLRENLLTQGVATKKLRVSEQFAHVEIYDNIFEGASFSTIYLLSAASISGSGNHILNDQNGGFSVLLYGYSYGNNPVIDLRNNFWGTEDPAQIDAWIYDSNDDPAIDTEVWYQPFSSVPLESSIQTTFDGLKALYR